MRLIRDGKKGGRGYGGGGRGRLYTYHYTVTTRMTPALRWAAMRAISMFQQEVMDKVTRQCPQTTTFLGRKESRSGIEPRSFRLPAYRLSARTNRLTQKNDQIQSHILTRVAVRCHPRTQYLSEKCTIFQTVGSAALMLHMSCCSFHVA